LIIDEVLAVGDAEFEKAIGKMQDISMQVETVLFVSHNMAAVQVCTRVYIGKWKIIAEEY
jgi:ABC-type polysaccharide/polyol phosphate transport system ATPase subunit